MDNIILKIVKRKIKSFYLVFLTFQIKIAEKKIIINNIITLIKTELLTIFHNKLFLKNVMNPIIYFMSRWIN